MIAHIRRTDGAAQSLKAHCEQVGALCEQAAYSLGLAKTAQLAGLLHDMGKGTAAFYAFLLAARDDPTTAVSPHYHAPTGAVFAYRRWSCVENAGKFQRATSQILALCIAGHHAGLMDCLDTDGASDFLMAMNQSETSLHYTEAVEWFCANVRSEEELDQLFAEAEAEITAFVRTKIQSNQGKDVSEFQLGMLTRLLLSIVVDADRWDSACFEYNVPVELPCRKPDWAALLARFEEFQAQELNAADEIGRIRADISDQCFRRAADAPGIYTLCVPTGGGKTFSSLRYGLRHAFIHQKQRIFYIIPYNTILDQNAQDIRRALSDYPLILEHHSNVVMATKEEQEDYRRLTERWDCDIILTSLVQFLNACFSAPNTDARRLHRLTNAILIFDEIQSLPKHCKTLFERAVTFLSACCGSTVVLCTATQPQLALTPEPVELTRNCDELFRKMKRVSYIPQLKWPMKNADAAARLAEMLTEESVLTIVNTKAVAREVYQETVRRLSEAGMHPATADVTCSEEQIRLLARQSGPKDILCVHLSTLLCPAHRKGLIQWVKLWLKENARVFCISTALIEAGINVSFPVVVRSLAGLPSVVQAAGRANRSMEYGIGTVYIWEFCDENLTCLPEIQNGGAMTRTILAGVSTSELDTPQRIADYFMLEQNYTGKIQDYPLESGLTLCSLLSGNQKCVRAANNFSSNRPLLLRQAFRTAYHEFKVIPETTVSVLVPFGEGERLIEQLLSADTMKEKQFLLRKAQAYSVSLYHSVFQRLMDEQAVWPLGDTGLFALNPGYYDMDGGVTLTQKELEIMII